MHTLTFFATKFLLIQSWEFLSSFLFFCTVFISYFFDSSKLTFIVLCKNFEFSVFKDFFGRVFPFFLFFGTTKNNNNKKKERWPKMTEASQAQNIAQVKMRFLNQKILKTDRILANSSIKPINQPLAPSAIFFFLYFLYTFNT